MLPDESSAHPKLPPAATAVTVAGSPLIATGEGLNPAPAGAALPSSPVELSPQHSTTPVVERAHANSPPIDTAAVVPVSPATATAEALLLVWPSPSCPLLFSPQQS